MTTPPDTPKLPAELWVVIDDVGQPEYAASYPEAAQEHINDWIENASDSTVKILGLGKYSSHRYILAPSPQESHKLAEELERDHAITAMAEWLHKWPGGAPNEAWHALSTLVRSFRATGTGNALADELERDINRHAIEDWPSAKRLLERAIAALRSSPSEQEMRVAQRN